MSTPDEYWMVETTGEMIEIELSRTKAQQVWAVGTGNQEVAWFINRDDALVYKTFCNAAVAAAKAKEQP